MIEVGRLDWDKGDGLIPAIIQDAETRQVLMLGYMNAESLIKTLDTKIVHFFSRSKQRLWMKGETSGNSFGLVNIDHDCDSDALLVEVIPKGPACHLDTVSCFGDDPAPGLGYLAYLRKVIRDRRIESPESSYVASLFEKGLKTMAQKVGEEGVEVAVAAVSESEEALTEESADLLFHLMVLLESQDLSLDDLIAVLRQRHSPREEKA